MSTEPTAAATSRTSGLPVGAHLDATIVRRRRFGIFWRRLLLGSLILALVALALLLYKVIDSTFGYVALEYRRPPAELLGNRPLDEVIPIRVLSYTTDSRIPVMVGAAMSRITRAVARLSIDAVNAKLQHAANATQRRRWLIVYTALVDPRPASSIALHTGVSVATVRLVISTYNRLGPAALDTPGKGGRRNEYLTTAEEHAFLAPFFARAARGEIATSTEIHHALEARVGQAVHPSTVYRLLARHGWRKRVPRPTHPQADPVAQAAFKTTSQARS